MGKIAPTVEEVKAELRVDFDNDDALIQRYISASADSVYADMYWINAPTQTLRLSQRRFFGQYPVRLPFRGIGDTVIKYNALNDDGEAIVAEIDGSGVDYETSLAIEPNRYIPYLIPVKPWAELFISPTDTILQLEMTASDAPELILNAISKMAVDCYMHNGLAPTPMVTAIERMLDPIRIYNHG